MGGRAADLQLDDLPPEALHSQLVAGILGPRQPALLLQGSRQQLNLSSCSIVSHAYLLMQLTCHAFVR